MVLKTVSTLGATGGGGGTVTAVTGSGNIASSGGATPNITFTGTLPVANGGTNLTSFTANGVVYASSSSALATGSGLQFNGTRLYVNGAQGLGSTQGIVQAVGSYLAYGDDVGLRLLNSTLTGGGLLNTVAGTNGGILLGGDAGPIAFSAGGSERMRLDASGNLGLGVTPSAWGSGYTAFQLKTYGSVYDLNAGYCGQVSNAYNNGTNWIYRTSNFASRYEQYVGNTNAHSWYIAPSGTAGNAITFTQAMTLDASGNLGIGTSSPASKLDILTSAGSSYSAAASQWTASNGTGSMRLWIVNAAYAGVAANEPWLHSYNNINIGSDAGVAIKFITNAAERARIDSSGNLLVGMTSAAAYANGFVVYPNFAAGQTLASLGHASGTASGAGYVLFGYNGGGIGSITQNLTTGVLYNTTSDYRLKTVNGSVTNAGARIDALKPVEYEWKADGSAARGFLAHEFQEVYPNSVTGAKDAVNDDGEPVYQNMQASTTEVIADLIAEIQSLRIRIAQLEAR